MRLKGSRCVHVFSNWYPTRRKVWCETWSHPWWPLERCRRASFHRKISRRPAGRGQPSLSDSSSLRTFFDFFSSLPICIYIFIFIYVRVYLYSFLASRPRSPLKLCGDQSITRSFEPSSRNGIIVLSSTTPSCHLLPPPSSFLCLPPRLAYLFILNRFYSQDIYYIISTIIFASRPEVCINRAWREDLLYPSPLSLFFFSFFQARTHGCTHIIAGGFEKTGWSIIIVMMGWREGGEGEEKTAMERTIVWRRRGRRGRRGGFSSGQGGGPWNLETTIPSSFVHEVRGPWPISFVSVILYLAFNLWNRAVVRLIVRNDLFIYSSSRYFKERQTRTERILIGDVFASEWNVFPCSYDVYLIFSLASTLVFTRAWRIKKGGEGKNCQILRFRSTRYPVEREIFSRYSSFPPLLTRRSLHNR